MNQRTREGLSGTLEVQVLAGAITDSSGLVSRASDPLYVAGNPWTVSAADATATRGTNTSIEFAVSLNGRDDCRRVTADWTTVDGTAVAGTDYTSSSGTLTFEPGETTKTVSVPLLGSSTSTDDKTLTLRLSNVTGHMAGLGTAEATGTIDGPDVAPLTARFEALPQTHDGETAFTFQLHFSEDVDELSFRSMREAFFDVSGGRVVRAQRLTRGENRKWLVRVNPTSTGDIVITTRAAESCDAAHAVCTADGRKYAGGDSVTVARDALSVADAQVREGADATLDFVVTLSRARSEATTVDYATSDGTATAGTDYTAASGTLTFAAGETSKTVSVTVLVDTEDEQSETLSLTLSNAAGARIANAVATGTVTDEESQQPVRALTASFHNVPAGHDGSTRFNVELHFSENIDWLGYRSVRDAFFDVSGGRIVKAQRLAAGKHRKWLVSVKPTSTADIVVTTRATASCDAAHAVCTADGRSYSGGDGATVLGPLTPRELVGTAGDDTLNGAGGDDTLHGDDGDPTITSPNEGNDVLYGDDGDDTLYGDAGDDDLYGGSDHDTLHGDRGDDTLYGDDGETDANAGADDLYGGSGEDSLYGDGGDDVLEGGADDDILEGGAGDDTLHGDDSADVLVTGDDELDGGPGTDTLTGGPGADTFVFGAGHGSDTITDFSPDESDLIDVSAFAGITAFANLSLSDDESDTVLALGSHGGGTVRLEGISAADLEAEDFVLPQ